METSCYLFRAQCCICACEQFILGYRSGLAHLWHTAEQKYHLIHCRVSPEEDSLYRKEIFEPFQIHWFKYKILFSMVFTWD